MESVFSKLARNVQALFDPYGTNESYIFLFISHYKGSTIQGLLYGKAVIPIHLDWHESVIKDRMAALLECRQENEHRMRKAVTARMSRNAASKETTTFNDFSICPNRFGVNQCFRCYIFILIKRL